jgi:hypothetical protein
MDKLANRRAHKKPFTNAWRGLGPLSALFPELLIIVNKSGQGIIHFVQ